MLWINTLDRFSSYFQVDECLYWLIQVVEEISANPPVSSES